MTITLGLTLAVYGLTRGAAGASGRAHGADGASRIPSSYPPAALTTGIGWGIAVASGLTVAALLVAAFTSPQRGQPTATPQPAAADAGDGC